MENCVQDPVGVGVLRFRVNGLEFRVYKGLGLGFGFEGTWQVWEQNFDGLRLRVVFWKGSFGKEEFSSTTTYAPHIIHGFFRQIYGLRVFEVRVSDFGVFLLTWTHNDAFLHSALLPRPPPPRGSQLASAGLITPIKGGPGEG